MVLTGLVLQQHLLDPDLLQDGRKLVVVEEVDHGVLGAKDTRCVTPPTSSLSL